MTGISPSAQAVAYLRSLEEDLSGDLLAKYFVSDDGRKMAENWIRHYPGVARQVALRGRYIEDNAASYIEKRNVTQMVNIAAGLNSFPYRHTIARKLLRYAELDQEQTIWAKQKAISDLSDRGLIENLPRNISYVAVDLASEKLNAAISKLSSWDWHKPTIFVLEGISYYLPFDTLSNVISGIKDRSSVGSVLIMDYFIAGVEKTEVFKRVMGNIEETGEPWHTCLDSGGLKKLFAGWRIVSDRTLPDIEKDYCPDCVTIEFDAVVVAEK